VRVNFNKNKRFVAGGGYQKYRNPSLYKTSTKKEWGVKYSLFRLKYLVYGLIGVLICYFLFYSQQFQVKEALIEGDQLLTKEEILPEVPLGSNIFRFQSSQLKEDLMAKFPEIKRVDIYRGIPNAIKVVIFERDAKLIWQSGDKKYLISSQGEVSRVVRADEGKDLPLVNDVKALPVVPGSRLVSPSFVAFVTNIAGSFHEVTNIKPSAFSIDETTFDVNVQTEAGFYVKFNSLRSSKKQLENLKRVLAEKRQDIHEYVDIRIDGWAYYK